MAFAVFMCNQIGKNVLNIATLEFDQMCGLGSPMLRDPMLFLSENKHVSAGVKFSRSMVTLDTLSRFA